METLYGQDRERDAEQAEQALREELTEQPDEAVADLQVFDDMVDMLGEIGRSERALDWCLAALAPPQRGRTRGPVAARPPDCAAGCASAGLSCAGTSVWSRPTTTWPPNPRLTPNYGNSAKSWTGH
ncbi:hypothetical protein [Streptomyces mirabilis]|uniref:hypothetical protein n=1 Tax=Streptomyces mirabilis TaxID=68239 RepID=UPI0034231049